jgi:hypothetical protein
MRRIVELRVLEHYRLWLRFDDGTEGEVDFSSKRRTGVYASWKDYDYFRRARIDSDGQLAWNDQVDFSADSLWVRVRKLASHHDESEPEQSTAHA